MRGILGSLLMLMVWLQMPQTFVIADAIHRKERGSFLEQISKGDTSDQSDIPQHLVFNPVLQSFGDLEGFLGRKGVLEKSKRGARRKRDVVIGCESDLCERSLCPWREILNINPARDPRYIKYAECRNSFCKFRFSGVGSMASRRLNHTTYCDVVRTEIVVFENNETTWIEDWPIACACSRNRRPSITYSHPGSSGSARQASSGVAHDSPGVAQESAGRSSDLRPAPVSNVNVEVLPVPKQRRFFNRLRNSRRYHVSRATRRHYEDYMRQIQHQNAETWRQYMERTINATTANRP